MISLHILWNDCHSKFSHHPSSYTNKKEREIKNFFLWWELLGATLLTTFLSYSSFMYYHHVIISNIYFVTRSLYLLTILCLASSVTKYISGFIYIWLLHPECWNSSMLLPESVVYLKKLYWGVLWMYCIFCLFVFVF